MTREEAHEDLITNDLDYRRWHNLHETIDAIYDDFEKLLKLQADVDKDYHNDVLSETIQDFESRTCGNCKWIQDEVCTNGDSRLCTEFVSDSDICKLWENKNDQN